MNNDKIVIKQDTRFEYVPVRSQSSSNICQLICNSSPSWTNSFISTQTCIKKTKIVCDYAGCNKQFSTKGNLNTHRLKHFGKLPYKCEFVGCHKAYSDKCRLITHTRTHTGEYPFKCMYCEKKFNERGNLKTHLRVHTNDRPYVCSYPNCSASFKAKGHLIDHSRSHSKIKCKICGKYYTRTSTLKYHLEKIHFNHFLSKNENFAFFNDEINNISGNNIENNSIKIENNEINFLFDNQDISSKLDKESRTTTSIKYYEDINKDDDFWLNFTENKKL